VKYNLGKVSNIAKAEGFKWHECKKWDGKKLKVGNWFSEMQYY
jgi:hypothetical protein